MFKTRYAKILLLYGYETSIFAIGLEKRSIFKFMRLNYEILLAKESILCVFKIS